MKRPALHFRQDGDAQAPALVLLHSLATHSELWASQRRVWCQMFRVISVDLPGHGASPEWSDGFTLNDLADEVLSVLDGLGIEQAAVVGLSLGGMVAQALALRHGARVQALVIAHAGARTDAAVQEIWNQRIAQFESRDMEVLSQSTLQRWFPREFAEQSPLTLAWVAGMIHATQPGGYISAIRAIQGLDHLDRLHTITAPTLVLAGHADAAVPPAVARQLAEQLPNAQLRLLDGTGHLGNVQAPIQFTEIVGAFLQAALSVPLAHIKTTMETLK
ncbi:alpha/beta fold hydrolase [Hydrogenophaga sp. OTU3427]|jgi:3-oxoadipate enol-lactonase|uniref:alpha/beta fold hydrolase n=1 Tax=Hydrogenophaga sp. OTU3427 TaxID=3043856 RepID=UPI00313ED2BE